MKRVLFAAWLTLTLVILLASGGRAQFFNPPMIFLSSGPSFALSYVTTSTTTSCSLNVCTFSSISFGAHTASKEVIVGLTARQSGGTVIDPLSVTVGLTSATQDALTINSAGNHTDAGIYRAASSSTSGNIVVTFNTGSTLTYASIAVWELLARNQVSTGVGNSSNTTQSLTQFSGGGSVGIANANGASATVATILGKDVDTAVESGTVVYSAGHSTGDSSGSNTVGLVMTSGASQLVNAFVAYGP